MNRHIPSRRLALVLLASGLLLISSPGSPTQAACEPVYGPNGSQDPALGYSATCSADDSRDAAVYGPNGSQDPALGFSRDAGDLAVADAAVYGPNGSQDPALGYVPAGDQPTSTASVEQIESVSAGAPSRTSPHDAAY